MKTIDWIKIIGILFIVSVSAGLILWFLPARGKTANIYVDGECIKSIDLTLVSEPYEFTVTAGNGVNTVRVEKGRICVVSSDCPDKVCVETSWISDSGMPIVCLPHKLVIRIEKESHADDNGFDAVTR